MPQALLKEPKTLQLFRPTAQRRQALEQVSRHELLTVNQLVYLLYGSFDNEDDLDNAQRSVRRTLANLRDDGFLHSKFFRPPEFKGMGKYPTAFWLSKPGAEWARGEFPATDPKFHGEERSENNVIHDLLRTDLRIALYHWAEKNGFLPACRKNDLYHVVEPDDLYEFTKQKTFRFFMESENDKKSFEEMFEKFTNYVELWGTQKCKELWGFRYFNVLIPMKRRAGMENLVTHLQGNCNCLDPYAKKLHARAPFKLLSDIFLFVPTDDFLSNPNTKLITPKHTATLLDICR